jgi:hypothetical protein
MSGLGVFVAALSGCNPDSQMERSSDGTDTPDAGGGSEPQIDPLSHSDAAPPPPPLVFSPPAQVFAEGTTLTVRLTSNVSGTIHFTVDGAQPTPESPQWPGKLDITETTNLRVAVYDNGALTAARGSQTYLRWDPSLSVRSNLPIVVIETYGDPQIHNPDRPREHRPAGMLVFEPGADGTAELTASPDMYTRVGMHVRGSSSSSFPKKQYKVELWDEDDDDDDQPLLTMPSESDWVLYAPYSDKSLLRNYLVYLWSNRIGRYAPRTQFCEVFIDDGDTLSEDDYVGVYLMVESVKVHRNRVAIGRLRASDVHEPAVTGGYLMARDRVHEDEGDVVVRTETYGDQLLFRDPNGKKIVDAQREYITDYLNSFERALSSADFASHAAGYAQFIDVSSFIDHHLLIELSRDVDGFILSTYMHKERSGLLHMGPVWDFNLSLGNADYRDAWLTEGWHHHTIPGAAGYRWYERLFEDPAFRASHSGRWRALRKGPLATDTLLADIDSATALLAGAAERNFARWDILGRYVWPNAPGYAQRTTYAAEIAYLKDWLLARLAWLDSQLQQ